MAGTAAAAAARPSCTALSGGHAGCPACLPSVGDGRAPRRRRSPGGVGGVGGWGGSGGSGFTATPRGAGCWALPAPLLSPLLHVVSASSDRPPLGTGGIGGGGSGGGLPTRGGRATYVEPASVAAPGGHRGCGRRGRGGGQGAAGLGRVLFPSSTPDSHLGGGAAVGHSSRSQSPDMAGAPPLAAAAGLAAGDDGLNGTVSVLACAVGVTCAQWCRFQRRAASTGRSLSRLWSSLCPTRVPSCPFCTSCVCWQAAPPQL